MTLWLVPAALTLDAVLGDPAWLYRRLPHPVVWFGTLIDTLDRRWNREHQSPARRQLAGVLAVALLLLTAIGGGALVSLLLAQVPGGGVLEALVASTLIAQRSLIDHVAAVAQALERDGLAGGRQAVSRIVGRDPASLDQTGVARAAIESCAENFSDGVVAPVLWLALGGLPGLIAYKMINTADSMIGHRTARHRHFGWAAARLDDLLNLVPARLTGGLLVLSAGRRLVSALTVMLRDARHHRSPNAGWPEAAMAGALGLALAGPRRYPGQVVDDPWLNPAGRRDPGVAEIRRSLRLVMVAWGIMWLGFCIYFLLTSWRP
jgi:adenosylcobinamide-phosphate synthase